MRGKRSKQYRKLMQQYNLTFGFREPYQVLIDAQMLQDTARFKMDLVAGLVRTLHGQVKPMITQCTIRHLYLLPTLSPSALLPHSNPSPTTTTLSLHPALKTTLIDIAKSFERRRCNHHLLPSPLSTLECLSSVIDPKSSLTNKNRYILASQDESMRRWARRVKGVPSVYVKRSVMVMEPMSEGSMGVREGNERGKLRGGIKEVGGKRKREGEGEGTGNGVGKEDEGREDEGDKKKRRVRGPKGPNPLSVRKAKKKEVMQGEAADAVVEDDDGIGKVDQGEQVLEGDGGKIGDPLGNRKKRKRKHQSGGLTAGDAVTSGDGVDNMSS